MVPIGVAILGNIRSKWMMRHTNYILMLTTAAGEKAALVSPDETSVEKIRDVIERHSNDSAPRHF